MILFILLFTLALRVPADADMWWHLRLGQHLLDGGEALYADAFSYTFAGSLHKNLSHAAQRLMFALWRLAGAGGMMLFTAGCAVLGMYFLQRAARGVIYMRAFVLVAGAVCAAAFWSPRPQMLTFLFGAALCWLLFDFKARQSRRLWWMVPLFWLWGNAHGGFIVGLPFIAAFVAGELLNGVFGCGEARVPAAGIRQLLLTAAAAMLALAVNPLGIGIYAAPFETLQIAELRRFVQEWQPPDFALPLTWGFIALLLTLIAAVWASRRRFDFSEWLLCCGTLLMALLAGRNLPLFAIAAVPVATRHIDSVLSAKGWVLPARQCESPRRLVLNLLLLCLIGLGAAGRFAYLARAEVIEAGQAAALPLKALEHLEDSPPPGRMFNSYNWGGYLMFYAPQHPVYIDGRTDLYTTFLNDYFQAATGAAGWRAEFERWDIGWALIESGSRLAEALAADAGWHNVYQDRLASIFVKAKSDA